MNILASRSNDVRQVKRTRDAAHKADLQASEAALGMDGGDGQARPSNFEMHWASSRKPWSLHARQRSYNPGAMVKMWMDRLRAV